MYIKMYKKAGKSEKSLYNQFLSSEATQYFTGPVRSTTYTDIAAIYIYN